MRAIILILLLTLVSCTESHIKDLRTPASIGLELNDYEEEMVVSLKSVIHQFSVSKDMNIEVRNSLNALEVAVSYTAQDQKSFELLSGIRMRTIKILYNELFLELQKQDNSKLDLLNRKKLFINFYKIDE